ncbi:glutathione-disulfide reductase [Paracoccus sp. S-4012]|uniref:glutathione-disulfide reductase n=1 Tax=Paracoccus sp. S-4012 TaxID=2665648 RepID=UPI0012B13537|nr:glutathione-disulfide reductase [Paracoccus sp. S-4012]MRX51162.1 glutathione-disulfide reductase [Paracoccus sp. S-4012]
MSDPFDFDLFVIGGGSGGVRAGRIAVSEHGAKVALAEESRMGGTCVIRGCVPKKLMIYAASHPAAAAEARGYGWPEAQVGRFDWPAFRGKLHAELDRLEEIYERGFLVAGGTLFKQRARIVDPHMVELADGRRVSARQILVATGGRPALPDIPGAEFGLISDDLFDLETLPRRVLVVGGGFIACEFATIFHGLGCETVMIHRGDKVLRGFDDEMRVRVGYQLEGIGIDLRLGVNATRLERRGEGVRVRFDDGRTEDFDAVMFATGRNPNTEGLGLEEAGVKLGRRGEVIVDRWSQTQIPSIYAVGDVTDRVNLTPVAIREGHAFADTVFGAQPRFLDHAVVASAVYTRPNELGTVGLTEEQAAERGPVEVYAAHFSGMRDKFAGSTSRVAMKLIVCQTTLRVLGVHIFAPEAGEMIQLAAIAIGMGATKADFDRTVAVHPTLAEEIVTLRHPERRHAGPQADTVAQAAQA